MKPLLSILLTGLFLYSCAETIEQPEAPAGGAPITTRIQLSAAEMIPMVDAGGTRGGAADNSSMEVRLGGDATRGVADKSDAEKKISKAWLLQFQGTEANSTSVDAPQPLTLNADGSADCQVMPDNKLNRLYVIANVDETIVKKLTANTTLAAFESTVFPQGAMTAKDLETKGLPMSGFQDIYPSETWPDKFELKSRLAKLTFQYKLKAGLTFTNMTATLRGIPSGFTCKIADGDETSQQVAEITYSATVDVKAATTNAMTIYVPENLAGRNVGITINQRSVANALPNSMLFDIAGDSDNLPNKITLAAYSVYLGSNLATAPADFNVQGNHHYDVLVNIKGTNSQVDKRVDVGVYDNMSLKVDGTTPATANCYIVNKAGGYYIDATKMGNEATTLAHDKTTIAGDKEFPAITPDVLVPTSTSVLWETVNTYNAPEAGSVVNGAKLFDNKLLFKSNSAQGNAVIAVKNAANDIIWSWHIWRTNDTPQGIGLKAIGTVTTDGQLLLMDRNLGALSATAQSDLSIGLLYQWGRKDPMPGGATLGASGMATTPGDMPAFKDGDSSIAPATAVANPTTFYTSDSDWTTRNDNLWGCPLTEIVTIGTTNKYNKNPGSKSIYDPCPIGWKVAPGYTYANASTTATSGKFDKGYSFTIATSGALWFPASGSRGSNDGTLNLVGANGFYWTSAPDATDAAYGSRLNFNGGYVRPASYFHRANGNSVRCVRDL